MESAKSAVSQALAIDVNKLRARQSASMIIHSLHDFIPSGCFSQAEYHLYEIFLKEDVMITTKTSREIDRVRTD